jgi:GNAT superfamily N-acetyltransferase
MRASDHADAASTKRLHHFQRGPALGPADKSRGGDCPCDAREMTNDVRIAEDDEPMPDELVTLYESVGWSSYTNDPQRLLAAIRGSSCVVTARSGGQLIGLARAVSDDATVCYLQDVLVVPSSQRSGVGRELVERVLERYATARQKVLLTDDDPAQRAFYESLGYKETRDFGEGTLRAFVRFDS